MILLAKEVMKMKLRKAKHSDLAAIMAIINQAKAYFKSHGINQWQDGYPNEISIVNDIQRNESYVLDNGKFTQNLFEMIKKVMGLLK